MYNIDNETDSKLTEYLHDSVCTEVHAALIIDLRTNESWQHYQHKL